MHGKQCSNTGCNFQFTMENKPPVDFKQTCPLCGTENQLGGAKEIDVKIDVKPEPKEAAK